MISDANVGNDMSMARPLYGSSFGRQNETEDFNRSRNNNMANNMAQGPRRSNKFSEGMIMPGGFNAQVAIQPIQPSLEVVYIEENWNEGRLLSTSVPQWWSISLLQSVVTDELKYRRLKVPPQFTFTIEPAGIAIDTASDRARVLQYMQYIPTGSQSRIYARGSWGGAAGGTGGRANGRNF